MHLRIEWVDWRNATCCNRQLLPALVIGRSRAVFWVDNINERCKHSSTTLTTPSRRSRPSSTREWCTGWKPITLSQLISSKAQPSQRNAKEHTVKPVVMSRCRTEQTPPFNWKLTAPLQNRPKPHPRISLNKTQSNNLHYIHNDYIKTYLQTQSMKWIGKGLAAEPEINFSGEEPPRDTSLPLTELRRRALQLAKFDSSQKLRGPFSYFLQRNFV